MILEQVCFFLRQRKHILAVDNSPYFPHDRMWIQQQTR